MSRYRTQQSFVLLATLRAEGSFWEGTTYGHYLHVALKYLLSKSNLEHAQNPYRVRSCSSRFRHAQYLLLWRPMYSHEEGVEI